MGTWGYVQCGNVAKYGGCGWHGAVWHYNEAPEAEYLEEPSEADAEHPKPELENWQNSTSLQPSASVAGGGFKLIGDGFCRTAAGDSGNFDVVRVRTERECKHACGVSSTCVGMNGERALRDASVTKEHSL